MKKKTFKGIKSELKNIRAFVSSEINKSKNNYDKNKINALILAIGEATMNIVVHGYEGGNDKKKILLSLNLNKQGIIVHIYDSGPLVDPSKIKSRKLTNIRPGGLGTYFMKQTSDDLKWTKAKRPWINCLSIKKTLVLSNKKTNKGHQFGWW